MEQLLTRKEVAAVLRVEPRTLDRYCRRAVDPLPMFCHDPIRFKLSEVEVWAARQKRTKGDTRGHS